MKDPKKCESCAKKVLIVSVLVNLALAVFKLVVGFMGRSRALIGSGLCNLSDFSTSIAAAIGVKYAKKPANKQYPYGYGKVEFIVQVSIGILMVLGTVALILSSFVVMAKRIFVVPHVIVFFVAMMSALVNGLIHKFAHCSAKELNSPVLKAHAEHNKIDVISSLMVAVTIPAARMGLHWIDPLVAIFEAVHVLWGSWFIFWEGLKGAMDSSLAKGYNDNIVESCLEVRGVEKVSKVRSRQLGRKVFLDIVIHADPSLSVLDSQRIAGELKAHLRAEDRHIGKILVQVVPVEK